MRTFACIIVFLISLFQGMASSMTVPQSRQEDGFQVRAAYLDFRTQVMTPEAMKEFARQISDLGMNAIIVEWEGTFPFTENLILRNRHAFSEEEVSDFISYCASLGVEVIPLQNCFGHAEYILRHDRYAALKEDRKDCSQVCPLEYDEAGTVFSSIFAEIARMHISDYIHIGCDETRLLGHCRECGEYVREKGISSLYVEYVSRMCRIVTALGKTPVIWADIILKYPEALELLPDDVIIADWNYGWKPDYFGSMESIEDSGHVIWGAASMRSHPDNLYLVQWRKHLENIFTYTAYAADHGFQGIINTSWSTSGTYGYIWDDGNEVVDIQPVREVYPQSGFDMLIQAFSAAVSGKYTDPDEFLDAYCRERLGLENDGDVSAVKEYFNMSQTPASAFGGKPERAAAELEKCLAARQKLMAVSFPEKAGNIAAHLRLMLDIRINYLGFKELDLKMQQDDFSPASSEALLEDLRKVEKSCEKLRSEFIAMNGAYLKDAAQSFNEWTYYGKMKNLLAVLENIRKH